MHRAIAPLFVLWSACDATAQWDGPSCMTEMPGDAWEAALRENRAGTAADLRAMDGTFPPFVVPVVFHVVHSGQAIGTFPNIATGQLAAQMKVLDDDLAGSGFNSGTYPPLAFMNWATAQGLPPEHLDTDGRIRIADLNIRFCMALTDPSGTLLPEPGVDRIDHVAMGWDDPSSFTTTNTFRPYLDGIVKPATIWDPSRYLNIWVTDKNAQFMFAGYATGPPLSGLPDLAGPGIGTATTDGIWCYAGAVGSPLLYPQGSYAAPAVRGRVCTHEVGHWLGLRHVWGDGNCATDHCEDTPPAAGPNSGAPTYPRSPGSCSAPSNDPDGELFMNFMDYTGDPFKYMFTVGQAIRAHTAMANSPLRSGFGSHGLCATTTHVGRIADEREIRVHPNPTHGPISIRSPAGEPFSAVLRDARGSVVMRIDGPDTDIGHLPGGVYHLVVYSVRGARVVRVVKM